MFERKIYFKRDLRKTKQLKMPFLLFVFNCELPSEYLHDPSNTLLFMLQEEVHLLVHPFCAIAWMNYARQTWFQMTELSFKQIDV